MKNLIIWILLFLILAFSFVIRVVPRWIQVFQPSMVVFSEVDPWYHMRLVDAMEANFPKPLIVDQYASLGGAKVGYYPVMAWIIIGLEKLTGIDYNIIGAFVPPAAAILSLILIFFIGKELFKSSWVGLGAALIASILPSQFLQRSLLGNTDHHILEALLLFLSILFFIKFSESYKIRYSILAGLSFTLYFMNWWGSLMMLVPVVLWILVNSILLRINTRSRQNYFYIGSLIIVLLSFLPLYLIKDSLTDFNLYLYSFIGLLGLTFLLLIISKFKKPIYFSLLSLVLIGGFIVTYYLGLVDKIIGLSGFALGHLISTIGEAAPMDLYSYFNIYNVAAFIIFPGLYLYSKNRHSYLFLIFTLFLFTLSVFQIRWSYYLIVSIAVVCSYFLYWLSQNVTKAFKAPIYTVAILMLIIPSIKGNFQMIQSPPLLDPAWGQAMIWLNINTPQPFNTPKAYIQEDLKSEPKYTVLSWWDYGHWVIRIGQRVPLTSPTFQEFRGSPDYQFLTAQSLEEARSYLKGLKVRYIVIDEAMVTGKFYAIVLRQKGKSAEDVNKLYENSMVKRLYEKETEGYKLIYDNGVVKILEILDYEKVSLGL